MMTEKQLSIPSVGCVFAFGGYAGAITCFLGLLDGFVFGLGGALTLALIILIEYLTP